MDLGIADRVALVMGAGGGLGRAVALELAAEGATVIVAGRSTGNTSETVRMIAESGGRAKSFVWDLADLEAGRGALLDAAAEFGPIEILIANTGGPEPAPVQGIESSTWVRNFTSMVLPVLSAADLVLPGMKGRGWGRIVTCASSGVLAPIPNLGISNTLRASLVAWSKTLATEVAPFGITANVVVPGRIDTERVASLDVARAEREATSVEAVRARSVASIPVGRYGDPREFARVVAFLAGEPASYVTGSVVRVDGGMVAAV